MVGTYLIIFQLIAHKIRYSSRGGYLLPFSLHSSLRNLIKSFINLSIRVVKLNLFGIIGVENGSQNSAPTPPTRISWVKEVVDESKE